MSNIMTFAFRLAWAITLAGGIGEATYEMMKSTAKIRQRGLISLKTLNRQLADEVN